MMSWVLGVLKNAVSVFISKKRIIGFIGAIVIAAAAAVTAIDASELKSAICDAPTIVIQPVKVPAADDDELRLDDE